MSILRGVGRAWALAALALAAQPAEAGGVLDRVRSAGALRCGGVARPGLAGPGGDGAARGLEVELCRALAFVALGEKARVEFTIYDPEQPIAEGGDLMFLTGREMVESGLTGALIPGPAIFIETTAAMVRADSPDQHLADLAGKPVCFSQGGRAQFHLHEWFEARRLKLIPIGFQEDEELSDGYRSGYCSALAGETTALVGAETGRLLPETLAAYPILAATSARDGEWAALVAWTIYTLQRADAPASPWARGGAASMPVAAPGLPADWQARLVARIGGFGELYDKTLGAKSPLRLPRAPGCPAPYVD
jgi:general L-amino acid transport system substrate-binding protein